MSQISKDILLRVERFCASLSLLPAVGSDLYVGLSGGPDSVALLHILTRMGYRCTALHCNFRLRADESDRDEHFCRQLCQLLDIPLHVRTFDTHAFMRQHRLSVEMAARQLRYDWWATLGSTTIALGHHRDDSLETALMNLLRGTGIQGLTGIVPRNAATHVIRPLLCLSRQDIIDYLRDNDLAFVTDSTNAHNDTLRNQIRNQLLPLMEQLVPQARTGIDQTLRHLRATAAFAAAGFDTFDRLTTHHTQWGIEWDELLLAPLTDALAEAFPDVPLDDLIPTFQRYWESRHCDPATQRAVRDALRLYTRPLTDELLQQQLEAHRPLLSIEPITLPKDFDPKAQTSTSYTPPSLSSNPTTPNSKPPASPTAFEAKQPAQSPTTAPTPSTSPISTLIPPTILTTPLPRAGEGSGVGAFFLRPWRPADRIAPFGMKGHTRLVSDLFTDAHYSPMQKATTLLLTDASDRILWVIGLRKSELLRIPADASEAFLLTLTPQ